MPAVEVTTLGPDALPAAARVLALACQFDRAADVAEEKLFGDSPSGPGVAWGVFQGGELVGVAAATARWLRVLAVTPAAQGQGVGSALLAHAEAAGARRTLDLPGNYLAPGIDVRNTDTIAWLERRGWTRAPGERTNLIVDCLQNPLVDAGRAALAGLRSTVHGYLVRRAGEHDRAALLPAIEAEFGGAWPFEVARALGYGGVHVALHTDGGYAAFAAHDGNNQGLGWFGPAGTWPAHRGKGLGEALLLACLDDVSERHAICEVAWIGPREFYRKAAGIAGERQFVVMIKDAT